MAEAQAIYRCHWPGCEARLPAWLRLCEPHWAALPMELRLAMQQAWPRRGEDDGRAYAEAWRTAQAWIAANVRDPAQGTLL